MLLLLLLVICVPLGYAFSGKNIFTGRDLFIKSQPNRQTDNLHRDSNSYGTLIDDDGYEYDHGSGGQWWADPVL